MAALSMRARKQQAPGIQGVEIESSHKGKDYVKSKDHVETYRSKKLSINGRSAAAIEITVTRDALVRECRLRLGAVRADTTLMTAAGDVRLDGATGSSGATFVVDFGMLRTVSGVAAPVGSTVKSVVPWTGLSFDQAITLPRSGNRIVRFPEVRTERLRITLSTAVKLEDMKTRAGLYLPGPPADLVLSVAAGAPLATFPGRVEPSESTELSAGEWNQAGERLVDVTAALAQRAGDPLGKGEVKVEVTLSAASPGDLSLAVETLTLSRLTRVGLAGRADRLFDLETEHHERIDLDFDHRALIEGVRFRMNGELPPPRVVDPQGPPASADAELVAGCHRSYAFRLPVLNGLGAVEGVRLPVRAEGSGAEARVTLWRAGTASAEPSEALAEGTSGPLPIPAGQDADAWITFPLTRPVPVDELQTPWAALDVVRGRVVVSLAAGEANGRAAACIRQGTANGQWRRLPAVFETGAGLAHLESRVRVVGSESETDPRLPVRIGLVGGSGGLDLDPAGQTLDGELELEPPLASDASRPPQLEVTAYSAGSARLEEVDLIWSEPPPEKLTGKEGSTKS